MVGSRTAVVYVRLALVQANPDSVSLVDARGLSFFFCCRTRSVVPVLVRHVAPVASLEMWPQIDKALAWF